MITSLCIRNCKHCCNKQYSLDEIPYVTNEELKECKVLCLTGGEPFLFTNPIEFANYYKCKYPNIKKVYVYTNTSELYDFLSRNNNLNFYSIDGLNVSIKNKLDAAIFDATVKLLNKCLNKPIENRLYVFDNLYINKEVENFEIIERNWQPDFIPADDSIFRKI